MLRPRYGLTGAICALGMTMAACAARVPVAATPAAPAQVAVASAPVAPAPQPQIDPVAELLVTSNRHFEAGQKELQDGHLGQAKTEFNRALEVLLESPYGARSEPRIR